MVYQFLKKWFKILFLLIIIGYLIPANTTSPVLKEEIQKIDLESFWHYPWGESGAHKGIDIFCTKGTNILAPVSGFVIKKGYGTISGNYIYILGPKWRTYYFAHMDTVFVNEYNYVSRGDIIGKAGNTGNAVDKPTHLHYSIKMVFPYFWQYRKNEIEAWKKTFYVDPTTQLGLE